PKGRRALKPAATDITHLAPRSVLVTWYSGIWFLKQLTFRKIHFFFSTGRGIRPSDFSLSEFKCSFRRRSPAHMASIVCPSTFEDTDGVPVPIGWLTFAMRCNARARLGLIWGRWCDNGRSSSCWVHLRFRSTA